MRLEIDISERMLYVYHGGETERYPVAVGMDEYPTPTGEFTISQVTWNPDWRPPESEWSEDEEYMPPEDPDVPMGKVKMMWQTPDYTIHGTDALESLEEHLARFRPPGKRDRGRTGEARDGAWGRAEERRVVPDGRTQRLRPARGRAVQPDPDRHPRVAAASPQQIIQMEGGGGCRSH